MALLSDILSRGGLTTGPGGALQKDDTLAGTADASGLPSTPVTPGAAASVGASPDAAKMAGTPAAVQAATTRAAAPAAAPDAGPTASLAQAERTGANQTQAQSAEQAQKQQRQASLKQAFGDVGLKVDDLVESAVGAAKQKGGPQAGAYSFDTTALKGKLNPEQQTPEVLEALKQLAANPADPATLSQAQHRLDEVGYSATDATQLAGLLKKTDAGAAASAQVEHSMLITGDVRKQIGLGDEDLAAMGLTPAQADGMTVDQLRQHMAAVGAQTREVGSAADLAASGTLDAGTARALGRDVHAVQSGAGATAEAQTQSALAEAQSGETMEIGGQSYKVADVLSDKGFTDLADRYLAAPEGSDIRKQVDEMMPSFGQFVREHSAALQAKTEAAEAGARDLAGIQSKNKEVLGAATAAIGPDAAQILKDAGYDLDKFATGKQDIGRVGVISAIVHPGPDQAAGPVVAQRMIDLKKQDPAAYKTLQELSPQEIQATGILGKDETDASKAWKQFQAVVKERGRLPHMQPSEIAKEFFGADSLESAYAEAKAAAALTGDSSALSRLQDVFDPGKTGRIDSDAAVAQRIKSKATGSLSDTLRALGRGAAASTTSDTLGGGAKTGGIVKMLSSAFAADGQPDPSKIDAAIPDNSDQVKPSELHKILDESGRAGRLSWPAQQALSAKIEKLQKDYTWKQTDAKVGPLKAAAGEDGEGIRAFASTTAHGGDAGQAPIPVTAEGHAMAQQTISALRSMLGDPNVHKAALEKTIAGLEEADSKYSPTELPPQQPGESRAGWIARAAKQMREKPLTGLGAAYKGVLGGAAEAAKQTGGLYAMAGKAVGGEVASGLKRALGR